MAIAEIIRRNITYCLPTDSVREVAGIMKDEDVGAVLVVQGGLPVGIITDRDITLRCVERGLDPNELQAEMVMSRGVETIRESEGIYVAAQKMKRAQVRRLAIVDDAGNAVGLISFDDVFDLLSDELESLRQVIQPQRRKIIPEAA